MRIGKQFKFEAAHRLPEHDGKCARQHGHSYLLWVEVEGETQVGMEFKESTIPKRGMVADFTKIKEVVNGSVIDLVDHQNLNEVVVRVWGCKVSPERYNVTTAEILCWLFASAIVGRLPEGVGLERVRLYETATSYAEWDSLHCTESEYEALFDTAQFARKE